ncbi:MAG: hypothetical protein HYR89_02560 [Actinobacteria bacterium]|nr:hypothetical protein [Actinomycetota bacterium]MBI3256703.1 hypothetical protein [Actinomycetota bacterium]
MNTQFKRLAPIVALAGLGLVTTGCSLLTPTTAPIVDTGATTGSDTGWFGSGTTTSTGTDSGWFGSGTSGGLFSGGGFGSGLFGGFFG